MSDTAIASTWPSTLLALQTARAHGERLARAPHTLQVVAGQVGWSTPYVIVRARRTGVLQGTHSLAG